MRHRPTLLTTTRARRRRLVSAVLTAALTTMTVSAAAAAEPLEPRTIVLGTLFLDSNDDPVDAPASGWAVQVHDGPSTSDPVIASLGPDAAVQDTSGDATGDRISVSHTPPPGWWVGDCGPDFTYVTEGRGSGYPVDRREDRDLHTHLVCFVEIPAAMRIEAYPADVNGNLLPLGSTAWEARLHDGDSGNPVVATNTPDGDWEDAEAELRNDTYAVTLTGVEVACSDSALAEFRADGTGTGTFTTPPGSEDQSYTHLVCVLPSSSVLLGLLFVDAHGAPIDDATVPDGGSASLHDGPSTAAPVVVTAPPPTLGGLPIGTVTASTYTVAAGVPGHAVVDCPTNLIAGSPIPIQQGTGTFSRLAPRAITPDDDRESEGLDLPVDEAHLVCVTPTPEPPTVTQPEDEPDVVPEPVEEPVAEDTPTTTAEPFVDPAPTPVATEETPQAAAEVAAADAERDDPAPVVLSAGEELPVTGLRQSLLPLGLAALLFGAALLGGSRRRARHGTS